MLKLQKAAVYEIIRMASAHPSVEVCGLVWLSAVGKQRVWALRNVHPEPDKYFRTDVKDVARAFVAMEEEDGKLVAWYHSHPHGRSTPSEEDMHGAYDVGMHYLIAYPETHEIKSLESEVPIRVDKTWRLSPWECITIGVLVEDQYEVIP